MDLGDALDDVAAEVVVEGMDFGDVAVVGLGFGEVADDDASLDLRLLAGLDFGEVDLDAILGDVVDAPFVARRVSDDDVDAPTATVAIPKERRRTKQ